MTSKRSIISCDTILGRVQEMMQTTLPHAPNQNDSENLVGRKLTIFFISVQLIVLFITGMYVPPKEGIIHSKISIAIDEKNQSQNNLSCGMKSSEPLKDINRSDTLLSSTVGKENNRKTVHLLQTIYSFIGLLTALLIRIIMTNGFDLNDQTRKEMLKKGKVKPSNTFKDSCVFLVFTSLICLLSSSLMVVRMCVSSEMWKEMKIDENLAPYSNTLILCFTFSTISICWQRLNNMKGSSSSRCNGTTSGSSVLRCSYIISFTGGMLATVVIRDKNEFADSLMRWLVLAVCFNSNIVLLGTIIISRDISLPGPGGERAQTIIATENNIRRRTLIVSNEKLNRTNDSSIKCIWMKYKYNIPVTDAILCFMFTAIIRIDFGNKYAAILNRNVFWTVTDLISQCLYLGMILAIQRRFKNALTLTKKLEFTVRVLLTFIMFLSIQVQVYEIEEFVDQYVLLLIGRIFIGFLMTASMPQIVESIEISHIYCLTIGLGVFTASVMISLDLINSENMMSLISILYTSSIIIAFVGDAEQKPRNDIDIRFKTKMKRWWYNFKSRGGNTTSTTDRRSRSADHAEFEQFIELQ